MTTTHTTTFTIYSTFLYLPVNVSTLHWSHQISGSVWSNAIGRFTWPSIVNIQCGSQKTVDFNNLYSLTMTAQKIHNHTSFSSSLLEPILLELGGMLAAWHNSVMSSGVPVCGAVSGSSSPTWVG